MRNKLFLTAFVSVIITGMPALAVDYLNCREMLRTKDMFISISDSNEKIELGLRYICKVGKVWVWGKYDLAKYDKIQTDKEKDEERELTIACNQKKREEQDRRRNQGETKRMGLYFVTDEGHYYYKKALKVEADMRRANCPY